VLVWLALANGYPLISVSHRPDDVVCRRQCLSASQALQRLTRGGGCVRSCAQQERLPWCVAEPSDIPLPAGYQKLPQHHAELHPCHQPCSAACCWVSLPPAMCVHSTVQPAALNQCNAGTLMLAWHLQGMEHLHACNVVHGGEGSQSVPCFRSASAVAFSAGH
jgi:hypothetical protein